MKKKRQAGNHKRRSLRLSCSLAMPGLPGGNGARRVTSLGSHSHALPSTSNPLPPGGSPNWLPPLCSQSGVLGPPTPLTPPGLTKAARGQPGGGPERTLGMVKGCHGSAPGSVAAEPQHARPLAHGCWREGGRNKRMSDA